MKVLGPPKIWLQPLKMKESVGSHGSQCNWEEKTLMMFLFNGTLWNIKTLVNSDKKSVVFLILAFIFDHGFFVTTEFIFW